MNIRQVETFYWAAKLGSFKAAASRLNATQSTVSTRIHELEEYYGVELFDRTKRTVRLTMKGSELFGLAEKFVQLTREMQRCMTMEASVSGTVRVGVSEIIADTWFTRLVKETELRLPRISVDYNVDLVAVLFEKLKNGDLDLLLAPRRVGGAGFVVHSLGSVDFHWLASPSLGLSSRTLTPRDFAGLRILTLSPTSNLWLTMDAWLNKKASVPLDVVVCSSMDVIRAKTIAGQGVSLFHMPRYQSDIDAGLLALIPTAPTVACVEFGAIVRDAPSPAVSAVAQVASELSEFTKTATEDDLPPPALDPELAGAT
ncbi:MAG: LysR family transcriptional regulator [Parvibaculaceae bacterium]